jgi:hypothetical protein
VTVFLAEDVTRADIASVQKRLLATRAVTQDLVRLEGARAPPLRPAEPAGGQGDHVNPFADRFEVVPVRGEACSRSSATSRRAVGRSRT